MAHVPPIVSAAAIGGRPAYLLGWERLPVADGGGWGARICWVEQTDDGAWLAKGGVVSAEAVRQRPGEDYSGVPRDPRPTDPADPRDPQAS